MTLLHSSRGLLVKMTQLLIALWTLGREGISTGELKSYQVTLTTYSDLTNSFACSSTDFSNNITRTAVIVVVR